MNRRTLLKGAGGLAAGFLCSRGTIAFAQGTPTADEYPLLTITVRDDRYDIPEDLTAGRYAVSVMNATSGPSHASLGRLPDGTTNDQVIADMSAESDEDPEWFLKTGFVGLPDWPAPGKTRTGIVDLPAGNYFMFDPFSSRHALFPIASGGDMGPEPASNATVELTEMHFILPDTGLPTGPARLKVSNIGAIAHEFQLLAVPEGTTVDQMVALFSLPFDATPIPGDPLSAILSNYQPVAATAILGAGLTSWIDVDIDSGTYAVLCSIPFPGNVPHAVQGMLDIITI